MPSTPVQNSDTSAYKKLHLASFLAPNYHPYTFRIPQLAPLVRKHQALGAKCACMVKRPLHPHHPTSQKLADPLALCTHLQAFTPFQHDLIALSPLPLSTPLSASGTQLHTCPTEPPPPAFPTIHSEHGSISPEVRTRQPLAELLPGGLQQSERH